MNPTRRNRVLAWLLTICLLGVILLLVWFLPVVAALLFVACVTFVAAVVGKTKGFWSGVTLFIKEMLFGW